MEKNDLIITKETSQNNVRFFINGLVSYFNTPVFQSELEKALKNGQNNLILNMSRTEYLCSSGVSIILKNYKDARKAGGNLVIEDPSERVKKVLSLIALDEILVHSPDTCRIL